MAVQLEKYVTLPDAARRLGLTAKSLNALIDSGIIKAIKLNGDIAVSESELKHIITRDQFGHLRGQAITVTEAAKKYGLIPNTIRNWVKRRYISVITPGYNMTLDHGDVAYCAAVYKSRGGGVQGLRLFDHNGNPFHPSTTGWATYQRERRKKKK